MLGVADFTGKLGTLRTVVRTQFILVVTANSEWNMTVQLAMAKACSVGYLTLPQRGRKCRPDFEAEF